MTQMWFAPCLMQLHPLEVFLASQRPPLGKMAFANKVGLSVFDLSRVFNGKRRRPSDAACLKIVAATGGAVTLEQLLKWEPPAALKRVDGRRKPRRTAPSRRAS